MENGCTAHFYLHTVLVFNSNWELVDVEITGSGIVKKCPTAYFASLSVSVTHNNDGVTSLTFNDSTGDPELDELLEDDGVKSQILLELNAAIESSKN